MAILLETCDLHGKDQLTPGLGKRNPMPLKELIMRENHSRPKDPSQCTVNISGRIEIDFDVEDVNADARQNIEQELEKELAENPHLRNICCIIVYSGYADRVLDDPETLAQLPADAVASRDYRVL